MENELPIDPQVLQAALELRTQLESRLIGRSCNYPELGGGPYKLVAVDFWYRFPGCCTYGWRCRIKDESGQGWWVCLSWFISWQELFPMFRRHFAGMNVQVSHLSAQLFEEHSWRVPEHGFTPSGRRVLLVSGGSAFLKPISGVGDSVWLNAELRFDYGVFVSPWAGQWKTYLYACDIDPFEFGQVRSPLSPLSQLSIIRFDAPSYVPIARVVELDGSNFTATFELDASVIEYQPDAQLRVNERSPIDASLF